MSKEIYDDFLYIVDSELNSNKAVHTYFNALRLMHKKYSGLFARYLVPKIISIGIREGFNHRMPQFKEDCITISKELAAIWIRDNILIEKKEDK